MPDNSSLSKMSENILEETCLGWLGELGWNISPVGSTLTPNPSPRGRGEYTLDPERTGLAQYERNSYSEVILVNRLRESLIAINPDVPAVGLDEAVKKLLVTDSPDLLVNNRNFHRLVTDGVDVEVPSNNEYGGIKYLKVWLVDIDDIENNDWLALNQLTVSPDQPSPLAPLPKGGGDKHYRGGFDFSGLVERARELRQKQTPAEELMWELLRNQKLCGLKFLRQHQIGEYITDFYCSELKLIIELDGPIHEETVVRDHTGDEYLKSLGNTVLRFKNAELLENPLAVLTEIARKLPSTFGRGVGGEGVLRGSRRADIVLYLNGLPVAVLELKNPGGENAAIKHAFNQLQTYKKDIPSLFTTNELLVISDGILARSGTLTSGWDRCMPWRTVSGEEVAPKGTPELETLVRGLFERRCFLDYILNFIVFEDDGAKLIKKAAAYHQYWAVNKALACTLSACGIDADPAKLIGRFPSEEDSLEVREDSPVYGKGSKHFDGKRIGVVWHTQGSGKSLSMTFYSGKVVRHPDMGNPTLVIITDRNDLDDQLFGTFANCKDLLRQSPVQAGNRSHLRELLKVASGGIVFTTIQKFMPDERGDVHPLLSDRNNIVVIADEAHRSQYDFIDGFARHLHDALPKASFVGFTGTPIESDDRSTPAVFGDYIDKYDILRAVEDGATVPIYYESRLARIELSEAQLSEIDPEFEQITEAEEETDKQKLKTKWAALEAMVGADDRVKRVVSDLAAHFEKRLDTMDGKAMIVCMSRRICVDIYNALKEIRPDWHSDDESRGVMKIVMSGSASDHIDWQPHIRSKGGREDLARRFKDPNNGLKLVIVRDMWLTGFDCPGMHTMYIDKPMSGHNLMQAIARVNRVFRDKPGGLAVDYIGLADSLKRALANYTASGGKGTATVDQEQAAAVLVEKYEVVRDMMHGFDYRAVIEDIPAKRISGITQAMEFILGQDDGKKRYLPAVSALTKAFALAVPHEKAIQIRDEVGFFQEVRAALVKTTGDEQGRTPDEIDSAIRQLVSRAVASTEVVDIFEAAGIDKPDISILSDEFLEEVKALPQKNLALELLKKLINDEIRTRSKKNVIQARSFAEMLKEAVKKYQNRAIEAAEIIQELIELARELRKSEQRGDSLGLTEDEVAFYDALADNGSARDMIGDEKLRTIAQLLVDRVKGSVSIDWTLRENTRAQIRVMVKRILRQYGYPPDLQKAATELVIEQAEVLCKEWSVE